MRLATDRNTTDIKPAFSSHLPKIGSQRLARRIHRLGCIPLGSMVLGAFGALGIAAIAASLQGFHPPVGWDTSSLNFFTCDSPGSPGFHPPWGIPLPSLGLTADALGLATASASSTPPRLPEGKGRERSASSRISGRTLAGTVPCASSVKELGSRLASHEAAGP